MAVTINRLPSFYIFQERILSCVHFLLRSLDPLHVAHQFTSVSAPSL